LNSIMPVSPFVWPTACRRCWLRGSSPKGRAERRSRAAPPYSGGGKPACPRTDAPLGLEARLGLRLRRPHTTKPIPGMPKAAKAKAERSGMAAAVMLRWKTLSPLIDRHFPFTVNLKSTQVHGGAYLNIAPPSRLAPGRVSRPKCPMSVVCGARDPPRLRGLEPLDVARGRICLRFAKSFSLSGDATRAFWPPVAAGLPTVRCDRGSLRKSLAFRSGKLPPGKAGCCGCGGTGSDAHVAPGSHGSGVATWGRGRRW
jgi:hypothetical protein